MKLILTLILLTSSITIGATTQAIYWQKLMLEEKVQHKISNSLNTVLAPNQFLVDVEIEVEEPSAPSFGDNGGRGPKVSDINLADSRGDYIAFSKVGLEVPVLDKYLDEDKTKLLNLYRFNESYDVFKNLQSAKVNVFLSDSLPPQLSAIAEKVVRSTRLSLGTVKPSFTFEKMSLEWVDPNKKKDLTPKSEEEKKKPEEPKEPKIWTKDWFEWASRWGNGFGLILSALIITFMALSLFRKWKEFMENLKKENEDKKEPQEIVSAENPEEDQLSEDDDMSSDYSFERFKTCLLQYPVEASNISREWIAKNTEESNLALRAVAQQLSSEEFSQLLNSLGTEQRETWKSVIGAYLTPAEIKEANKVISRDVLKALLVPAKVKDSGLLNLLMELGPDKIRQFLMQSEHYAGAMLNLLSPSVTSSVLNDVAEEKAENWITAAATIDLNEIQTMAETLKGSLIEFKKSLAPSHFNSKLAELILTSPPSKERMLFRSIAKTGGASELVKVAEKLFPSDLILKLPDSLIKEAIHSLPMAKRLDLLISLEDENRERLLNSFAESGTQARELMDMEIENITNDPGKVSVIKGRAEDHWREFVDFVRQTIQRSPQYRPDIMKLIQVWAKTISPGLKMVDTDAA